MKLHVATSYPGTVHCKNEMVYPWTIAYSDLFCKVCLKFVYYCVGVSNLSEESLFPVYHFGPPADRRPTSQSTV